VTDKKQSSTITGKDFKWDEETPLERSRYETKNANLALLDYARMGPGRSLVKLHARYADEMRIAREQDREYHPPTKSMHTLGGWSFKYHWVKRVAKWEQDISDEEEREWTARRREARKQDWEHSGRLRTLALQILDAAPAFVRQSERTLAKGTPTVVNASGEVIREGTPERTVVTIALSTADLTRVEKLASDLSRLAAGMETERIDSDITFHVVHEQSKSEANEQHL